MSEPIPESVPTTAEPRSRRPTKRVKLATTPLAAQSQAVEALFERQPIDQPIHIPTSATPGQKTSSSLAPPPEIVTNVQGSSAGAGSGEFHVYKASRRREYERIRLMEDEANQEEADREWKAKQEEIRLKDEEKRKKNAQRRAKQKGKKGKVKGGGGMDGDGDGDGEIKVNLGGAAARLQRRGDGVEDGDVHEAAAVAEEGGIVIHDDD